MVIAMSTRNQITLPKAIIRTLHLHKGARFDIKVTKHRIELIPLGVPEKIFTTDDYRKLEKLYQNEKHTAKKITKEFINSI